jgi:hypothetical protein
VTQGQRRADALGMLAEAALSADLDRGSAGDRYQGCTSHRCDAHQIEHWLDGGETSLDKLVLLCRRHHRSVHEGLVDVRVRANGSLVFIRPDGQVLEPAPYPPLPLTRFEPLPQPVGSLPTWDGTPLDVVYAIDVLYKSTFSDEVRQL